MRKGGKKGGKKGRKGKRKGRKEVTKYLLSVYLVQCILLADLHTTSHFKFLPLGDFPHFTLNNGGLKREAVYSRSHSSYAPELRIKSRSIKV